MICDSSSWQDEGDGADIDNNAIPNINGNDNDASHIAFALTTHHQVQELAAAIRYHPSLLGVSLQECYVAPHLSLDPIVQALATVPRLENMNITLTQSAVQRLQNESIIQLFQVETLQDVTLWSMGLDDAHLEALCRVVATHPALVFFSLRCNPKITPKGWQALCDMVVERDNCILRSVYTDQIVSPERENLLQTFLYWNQCGRAQLLESNDPLHWLDTILRWKTDPTALYYLVRQGHPWLLSSRKATSLSSS